MIFKPSETVKSVRIRFENIRYIQYHVPYKARSRGSEASIATSYRIDGPGFESRHGARDFLFSKFSRPSLGHTHSLYSIDADVLSWVKWPGRENKHSPPSRGISGGTPLLPWCSFMALAGPPLPLFISMGRCPSQSSLPATLLIFKINH